MSERWKPGFKDAYYFIDSAFNVDIDRYDGHSWDDERIAVGNCFNIKDDAHAAAEKVKDLLLSLHEPTTNSSQSVTDCNQLPKLTAEVFNRPDCPEWAKYAAVDAACLAYWYQYPPIADERVGAWAYLNNKRQLIDQYFNRSDWQNSLIERPTKLPDWCKVGAVGYHKRCGYFEVTYIDDVSKRVDIQQVEDKSKGYLSFHTVCTEVMQSRLRTYNAEEMCSLVGMVIKHNKNGDCELVLSFHADNNSVETKSWLMMEDTLLREYTIDGHQCGVFEHRNEDGEWVK